MVRVVVDLAGHLNAVDRASLFDSFERAATRVGFAPFVVLVSASPPTLIYCSELLGELVGRPARELVGQPPWVLVAPAERERVRDLIASRGTGAPPISLEVELDVPNRKVEVAVARITTSEAELAVCYLRDITHQLQTVAALRHSESAFRSLIEHAPDAVVIIQDGRVVLANPVAVRMFGAAKFEAIRGRLLSDFLPPEEGKRALERMGQLFAGGSVASSEYRLLHSDLVGEVHSVVWEYENKPAILAFVRDVTERRRMQEQLFRGDRLAVLGTMAASVAHEINNPLTYLQLNLQRVEREAALDGDPARAIRLRDHIANALHGVERVARIVRDLRAYSRDHSEEPESPIDVVAVVEQALQMVEHDVRYRAELVRHYPDEPAIVDGTSGRLEQVVVNLLVNAIQALDTSRPSNQITISIEVAETVQIAITDTGLGLSDPERVFEPFFSTKPRTEGTGLGLYVCKQLVERMRGTIEVVQTSSQGTTFAVRLPRRVARPVPPRTLTPQEASERFNILVIDDEPLVRDAIKNILALEHEVEAAGDGESALDLLTATPNRYDVILCDVMMPRMNGHEVYERIRARWPGLERRIVFVTGGAFVSSLAGFLDSVDNLKLRKPFSIENVLKLVRDVHRRSKLEVSSTS